jgi:hypothetical protein
MSFEIFVEGRERRKRGIVSEFRSTVVPSRGTAKKKE